MARGRGKYTRKCRRGVKELAVMEGAEMVGAHTRARAEALASMDTKSNLRRSAAMAEEAAAQEVETMPYVRLRSRSPRRSSPEDSSSAALAEEVGTHPTSSYGSSEVVYEDEGDGSESLQTTSGLTPESNEIPGEAGNLETTDGFRSRRTSSGKMTTKPTLTPTESEVEEFFAAFERDERRLFAEKYNYDITKDVPLDGRFEWCPVSEP